MWSLLEETRPGIALFMVLPKRQRPEMLYDLPFEIVYHIALFLPTATSVTNLAQTCRRLHAIITAEGSRIYRAFVSTKFPQIETPPFWKDAAQALASRSRALDRHAVIGRFVLPPRNAVKIGSHQATRRDNPTLGYRPAIDSYETWNGDRWADRKEVLAWGAADKVVMQIKQSGTKAQEKWLVFSDLEQTSSHDDICGVCLLKPSYHGKGTNTEHLIFGRVRGELVHLAISPDKKVHEYKRRFETSGLELERIDLSDGPRPTLAAHFANGTIAFYDTTSEESSVQPFTHIRITSDRVTRNKCSRFLSPHRYALSTGRFEDSLSIATVSPDGLSLLRTFNVHSIDIEEHTSINRRSNVTAVSPLPLPGARRSSGDVFLAAWGDRAVRLHDLRSRRPFEATFRDSTDQNPVYSILPFGHDRFVVGAGGDAVVKIFDLRMPNTYNYLDAKGYSSIDKSKQCRQHTSSTTNGIQNSINYSRKDFSLFLSQPFPGRRRARRNGTYRGPIYTLSSPSPSSPSIYAGVVDGVFRLDFASTDDLTGTCSDWYRDNLALDLNTTSSSPDRVLQMSGYERPDPEAVTSSVQLRTQLPFSSVQPEDIRNEQLTGWDRRWERLDADAAWRRRQDFMRG